MRISDWSSTCALRISDGGRGMNGAPKQVENVFLGDRFRLGTALVEVTQARQPCWKLDHRFETKGVMAQVVKTRRTGWYYRVLEPGAVREGEALDLDRKSVVEGKSVSVRVELGGRRTS